MSEEKPTLWTTYSWDDNDDGDVDFIAQELISEGINVKLDKWNLKAGLRLWDQIEKHITDPNESDGWLLIATENSLGSEPCKEEYAYALGRALETRGGDFPVIALFMGEVDRDMIPAGIKTRLYVSVTDPDWKERIKAAAEGRIPGITVPELEPFVVKEYEFPPDRNGYRHLLVMRPRVGTWNPFFCAIPEEEQEDVAPKMSVGSTKYPPKAIPQVCVMFMVRQGTLEHQGQRYWCYESSSDVTPMKGIFMACKTLPSIVHFGEKEQGALFVWLRPDR